MRDLTAKQKKLLEKCLNENPDIGNVEELITKTDLYEELEKINDTEVLFQNVDRFIWDKRFNERNWRKY